MLKRGLAGAFACVCDPAAVARARAVGVGGEVEMPVGGASPEWSGEAGAAPLAARWRVRGLTDGRFGEPRPRHGGIAAFDQGPTAVNLARFNYHHRRRPLFPWEDAGAVAGHAAAAGGEAHARAANGAAHAAGTAHTAPPPFDTSRSQALLARSRQSLAMGVASGMRRAGGPTPLFFERGVGPYSIDVDGHRLLDYTLAWGPLIPRPRRPDHPHPLRAAQAQSR